MFITYVIYNEYIFKYIRLPPVPIDPCNENYSNCYLNPCQISTLLSYIFLTYRIGALWAFTPNLMLLPVCYLYHTFNQLHPHSLLLIEHAKRCASTLFYIPWIYTNNRGINLQLMGFLNFSVLRLETKISTL